MTTIRSCGLFRVSIVALAALLRPPSAIGHELKFRGSFANLDGSTAAARLHGRIGDSGSWMVLRAMRLGGSVQLSLLLREAGVPDTAVATFTSDRRGQASLRFRTVPRTARDLPLGFDPRGKTIVISVFTAVVCLIATAAALTARETKDVPTALLGRKAPDSARVLVDH